MLLDDELPGLTYLKMLCEQIPELEVVRAFNSPVVFLQEIADLDFDLCILDIEMPEMNGLHVANLLGGKPVIFTTAYKEYAAEAFDLNAIDYVRKPVQKERLQQAVQKALKQIGKPETEDFVQLNTDKGKTILHFNQISYIKTSETDSRDKLVRMTDGSRLTLKNISFEKLKNILPDRDFCQINKQEIIAILSIRFFSSDMITTNIPLDQNKDLVLNLGDSFRSDFLRKVTGRRRTL